MLEMDKLYPVGIWRSGRMFFWFLEKSREIDNKSMGQGNCLTLLRHTHLPSFLSPIQDSIQNNLRWHVQDSQIHVKTSLLWLLRTRSHYKLKGGLPSTTLFTGHMMLFFPPYLLLHIYLLTLSLSINFPLRLYQGMCQCRVTYWSYQSEGS